MCHQFSLQFSAGCCWCSRICDTKRATLQQLRLVPETVVAQAAYGLPATCCLNKTKSSDCTALLDLYIISYSQCRVQREAKEQNMPDHWGVHCSRYCQQCGFLGGPILSTLILVQALLYAEWMAFQHTDCWTRLGLRSFLASVQHACNLRPSGDGNETMLPAFGLHT